MGLFLPVYAEHKQGIGIIGTVQDGHLVLGATGGYIIGFVAASGIVGPAGRARLGSPLRWRPRRDGDRQSRDLRVRRAVADGSRPGWTSRQAFALGVQPFLLGDLIKLVLAAGVFPIAWWVVGRSPEER